MSDNIKVTELWRVECADGYLTDSEDKKHADMICASFNDLEQCGYDHRHCMPHQVVKFVRVESK